MFEQGVDWVGLDINATKNTKNKVNPPWTRVIQGGPDNIESHAGLKKGRCQNPADSVRALLLCYPDDFEDGSESLAYECISNYKVRFLRFF